MAFGTVAGCVRSSSSPGSTCRRSRLDRSGAGIRWPLVDRGIRRRRAHVPAPCSFASTGGPTTPASALAKPPGSPRNTSYTPPNTGRSQRTCSSCSTQQQIASAFSASCSTCSRRTSPLSAAPAQRPPKPGTGTRVDRALARRVRNADRRRSRRVGRAVATEPRQRARGRGRREVSTGPKRRYLGVEHARVLRPAVYPLAPLSTDRRNAVQRRRRQHAEKRSPLSSTAIQPAFHCNISPNARRRLSPRFTQASMRRA